MSLIFLMAALAILWATLWWTSPRGPVIDMARRVMQHKTPADDKRLRFAIATMVSPQATFASYRRMVELIGHEVGLKGGIVLRPTYRQVRESLEKESVDVAFVCTGTYVHGRDSGLIELLAQPQFKAGLSYRCVIIVPRDSSVLEWDDLKGKTMAFTDPESNTGSLVPRAALITRGYKPAEFFGKIIFTGSHDRSVRAVANCVVDAAAVDSLVFYPMINKDPSLSKKVRVIWTSEPFGPPAIVVPTNLDAGLKAALRQVLFSFHKTSEGSEILAAMGIERFRPPRKDDYDSAYALFKSVQEQR
ncbi:MAG: phosphate/phosphite/phosphonate ABC transporter substrate-binding protein [Actinobacteria bacterium]|nr:phosphate/phosphite/phosphonate ABC transporter substrate-binding protein [Actinomycetota bacterium]